MKQIRINQDGMTANQVVVAALVAQLHLRDFEHVKQHTYERNVGTFKVGNGKTVTVGLVK